MFKTFRLQGGVVFCIVINQVPCVILRLTDLVDNYGVLSFYTCTFEHVKDIQGLIQTQVYAVAAQNDRVQAMRLDADLRPGRLNSKHFFLIFIHTGVMRGKAFGIADILSVLQSR